MEKQAGSLKQLKSRHQCGMLRKIREPHLCKCDKANTSHKQYSLSAFKCDPKLMLTFFIFGRVDIHFYARKSYLKCRRAGLR